MGLFEHLDSITDDKVYSRGVNLYKEQKVHDLFVSSFKSPDDGQFVTDITSVVVSSEGFTNYDNNIVFTQDKLIKYFCDCIYFSSNNCDKICKHLVATFLSYSNVDPKENKSKIPSKSDLDNQLFFHLIYCFLSIESNQI